METTDRIRIYGKSRENLLTKALTNLQKSQLSNENKKNITTFAQHIIARGNSETRAAKLASQLRKISPEKNLNLLTPQDIDQILYKINTSKLSNETKHDYLRAIKQYYNWQENQDPRLHNHQRTEATQFYKYLKNLRRTTKKTIKTGDILTEEDITQVIQKGTNNYRDKLLLKLLHETGMRCSEILSLKIKDITIKGNIAHVRVPSMKTEERTIPIIHTIPHYYKWKEIHPHKHNPDAYLFIGENRRVGHKPLQRAGTQKIINRCFQKAGITKKHNFHWFRHSRATLLAPNISEVILCKYMGWTIGSKQVTTYVHLIGNELTDKYAELNGIKTETTTQNNKPKICVCQAVNEKTDKHCHQCGQPLDLQTILGENLNENEITDELNKTMQILIEIAKNPTLLAKFEQYKKEYTT